MSDIIQNIKIAPETILTGVSELAEKYGLPESATREEIERAVSMALTSHFGYEVEGVFNDDGSFAVWVFRAVQGETKVERLRSVPWKVLTQIRKAIEQNLYERVLLGDYEKFNYLANSLAYGQIIKLGWRGELIVEIENGWQENIIGTCSVRHQPPLERGFYAQGERLPFYVLKVLALRDEDGTPRLEIPLSRTSKRLVELLLKEEIDDHDLKIKCIRRIAGGMS